MSSNRASAALSKAHISLIREVLRSAGLRGVDSPASSDTKRDASAFLTTEFRSGVRTKGALAVVLDQWNKQSSSARASNVQVVDRQPSDDNR